MDFQVQTLNISGSGVTVTFTIEGKVVIELGQAAVVQATRQMEGLLATLGWTAHSRVTLVAIDALKYVRMLVTRVFPKYVCVAYLQSLSPAPFFQDVPSPEPHDLLLLVPVLI